MRIPALFIFEILKTKEYKIIAPNAWVLTTQSALMCTKMKKIAGLLCEIGYPLARRVINLLLKTEPIETGMLCERLLLRLEDGRDLLAKLRARGVIQSEELGDAPHTSLKKKYVMWRLNPDVAINHSCAYLLGVLTKLYCDLIDEENHLKEEESLGKEGAIHEKRRKTLTGRITVLNNTMVCITRKYIESHEL